MDTQMEAVVSWFLALSHVDSAKVAIRVLRSRKQQSENPMRLPLLLLLLRCHSILLTVLQRL